jgi:hypothetical protein
MLAWRTRRQITLAKEGRSVEVIDLRGLQPWDEISIVAASVAPAHRCVVLHEAVTAFGPGAEIAARITEMCFADLAAPVGRVGSDFIPIAFALAQEAATRPQLEPLLQRLRQCLASNLPGVFDELIRIRDQRTGTLTRRALSASSRSIVRGANAGCSSRCSTSLPMTPSVRWCSRARGTRAVAGGDIADLNSRQGLFHHRLRRGHPRVYRRVETLTADDRRHQRLGAGRRTELACAWIRLLAEGAKMGLPEITLGLFPGPAART